MTILEPPLTPPLDPGLPRIVRAPLALIDAVAQGFDRMTGSIERSIATVAWDVAHVLGTHRWRDGFETNAEAGWRQYRGSRCTICDTPWEGW